MELIVGRVLSVDDHPGARAPSYLLRVDLGGRGERDAQMEPGEYDKDTIVGSLVVVSLSGDEAIVLPAPPHPRPPPGRGGREGRPGTGGAAGLPSHPTT